MHDLFSTFVSSYSGVKITEFSEDLTKLQSQFDGHVFYFCDDV